ncbi:MAG TPA: hypothetical protein DCK79_06450 [Candidatus Atribacteria bacterium]|jgi:hypothetical protein|nr:hypothetical protein [Candidatus Atribacteria bacterium]
MKFTGITNSLIFICIFVIINSKEGINMHFIPTKDDYFISMVVKSLDIERNLSDNFAYYEINNSYNINPIQKK